MRFLLAAFLLALCSGGALAQPLPAELGRPYFLEHFEPHDYGADAQNWKVAQSASGLIYVANHAGVLEFDGVAWRFVETPRPARSLAAAGDSVYVGLIGDVGYLASDSLGQPAYHSLLAAVPDSLRDFTEVWATHIVGESVFFQSRQRLLRWDGTAMHIWEADGPFHTSFVFDGDLYVREHRGGLYRLQGDEMTLVPGGERFARQAVFAMLPYPDGRALIATRSGLWLFDGQDYERFETPVEEDLRRYRLYTAAALPGDRYALGTINGGVVVIDAQGQPLQYLDHASELPEVAVNHVFADAQGGLWLAHHSSGLVRVDAPSPVSRFDSHTGLHGVITSVSRHRGQLYVGTGSGVFEGRLRRAELWGRDRIYFEEILERHTNRLLSVGGELLAATNVGIYVQPAPGMGMERIGDDDLRSKAAVYQLRQSSRFPDRIYAATSEGLAFLRRDADGRWTLAYDAAPRLGTKVYSLHEEPDGTLWLGAGGDVLRLRFGSDGQVSGMEHFGSAHGLPDERISIRALAGEPVFASTSGLYRQRRDGGTVRFARDEALARAVAPYGDGPAYQFLRDSTLWHSSDASLVRVSLTPEGTYETEVPEDLALLGSARREVVHIEGDGTLWMRQNGELVRYDGRRAGGKVYGQPFQTHIRDVRVLASGQAVYAGARVGPGAAPHEPTIESDQNDLTFTLGAPAFNARTETRYQYRLEGVDAEWSGWVAEPRKSYTNIPPGRRVLEVRARNAQGVVGAPARLAFVVRPPWFRTWWAYALYLCAALGVVALVRRQAQLRKQSAALAQEREVNERLQEANQRLQQANQQLQQANQLKDNFLANTSHELRTPLTAILGFTEVLREELGEGQHHEFLDLIHESGERLVRTLNALLDLARLRAGMVDIEYAAVELGGAADDVVRMLSEMARQQEVGLTLETPTPVWAYADAVALERILYNLVGNALKFTESGGHVVVRTRKLRGRAVLEVEDNGVGIDPEFLPHLFDEFRQESGGLARSHNGSGLGLAITRRLVDLLQGEIEVESVKGEGSLFRVSFAYGVSAEGDGAAHADSAAPRPAHVAPDLTARCSTATQPPAEG